MRSGVLRIFGYAVAGLMRISVAGGAPRNAGTAENLYRGEEWSLLDSKAVLAAAAEITPQKFPNCDEATVDWKSMQVYRIDGTARIQDEWYIKVLTERGRRGRNTVSLDYQIPYSTAQIALLQDIKPGGRVVQIDVSKGVRDSIDAAQMAENIYDPNDRVLSVGIPDLEVGDIVHAVTRRTIGRPVISGGFDSGMMFEGGGYIRHASYEVRGPAGLPLRHILLRDSVPGTVRSWTRTENGTVIHHWEANRVPRAFGEPSMPPDGEVMQRVLVGTGRTWQGVSRWYWMLCEPHLSAVTPEMREEVARLVSGAATDESRIEALFYYVANGIRYMGIAPEKNRPGYEPHDVSLTFGRKYGVCRDKAALLVALLRIAGFEAYPVLTNVGMKMDPDCPVGTFNHAIAGVRIKGVPGWRLMDPTNENPADLLPAWEGNQSYLICGPKGYGLALTPVIPPERNMMTVRTTGVLGADGTLKARSEWLYEGVNDSLTRPNLARMAPDARWRAAVGLLKNLVPGAVLRSLEISPRDMTDTSKRIRVRIGFEAPESAVFGKGFAAVTIPWLGGGLGAVQGFGDNTGLDTRRYPLETRATFGLDERISIKLPRNFARAVSLPTSSPVEDSCLEYRRRFDFHKGSISCARELKAKVVEFSPSQYPALKNALRDLQEDSRKTPLFALAGTPGGAAADASAGPPVQPVSAVKPDVRILEQTTEFAPQDRHAGSLTMNTVEQVLTEAGKQQVAELKLPYDPALATAALLRAVVVGKDGTKREADPNEIHVMDQGWNSAAKRYTGGKVLVANLPGVEIGSRIELTSRYTFHDKPYLWLLVPFEGAEELAGEDTVRISAPRDVRIHAIVTNPRGAVKATSGISGGRPVSQWTVNGLAALPDESNQPPAWAHLACLDVYVGDPGAYYRDLEAALLDRSRKSAEAAKVAARLVEGAGSKREAVAAIRDFVNRRIRFAGPWFLDLPLRELSPADTTLADGYGNMGDLAILLHAMLSAVGFKPEFVLASDIPAAGKLGRVARTLPLPPLLTDLVVAVDADGATYYLNDTDRYARLGTCAHDGDLGLRLSTQTLTTLEAVPECRYRLGIEIVGVLRPDGDLRATVTLHYYGLAYAAKKKFFAQATPEERRRYLQGLVAGFAQGARAVGDLTTDFEDYPGTERFGVDARRVGVVDGDFIYFDYPGSLSFFKPDADRRSLPMEIGGSPAAVRLRSEIHLPAGYRSLMAPAARKLVAPDGAGEVRVSVSNADGGLAIDETCVQRASFIPSKDYPALVRMESELDDRASRFVLLERAAPAK